MQKINNKGDFEPFTVKELNRWLNEQLKKVDGFSATLIIDANGVTGDLVNKFPSQPNYKILNQGFKPGDSEYIGASRNTDPGKKNVGKWSLDLNPNRKSPIKSLKYKVDDFSKLP